MPYPKPLSEKSIARLYAEAGLQEEQIAFLHTFCLACANLYGVISAEEAWDVYRELSAKTQTVRLHRRELYAALGILRREELPYYVFEVDEVYSGDARRDGLRLIVYRELVGFGYGKFFKLYVVDENTAGKPFYVPENLLSYTVLPESEQEQALLRFLNGLRSTRSQYTNPLGKIRTCPYKGKYLHEFAYISERASFELDWLNGRIEGRKGNPKRAAELEAKLKSVTAARYLVEELKWGNNLGHIKVADQIKYFFNDLTAMGVVLSGQKQEEALLHAIFEMCTNQHLWCNRGWTPKGLSARMGGGGEPTFGFGWELEQMIADGAIDKDEGVRILRELWLS